MAVSRMKKVNIVGFAPDKDNVLKTLQEGELIQINSIGDAPEFLKPSETEKEELDNLLKNLEFSIEYLSGFEKKKKGGMLSALAPDIISKDEFNRITQELDIKKITDDIQAVYRKQNELKNDILHYETEIETIQVWKKLDIKLNQLGTIGSTERFLVRINPQMYQEIEKELSSVKLAYVEKIATAIDFVYLFILVYKDAEDEVYDLLKKANYESINLESFDGTIADFIQQIELKIKELKNTLESNSALAQEYSDKLDRLKIAYDFLLSEYTREEAKEKVLSSQYTYFIDGWVPEKKITALEKALSSFKDTAITIREPDKEELPPTQYSNKGMVSPYEMIISMYSPPQYREVDPTPLIMPFFTVFFAVCLTDAGYGLFVALFATFILSKIPKQKKQARKMWKVLLFAGMVTVVIGLLTGGIFGISFEGPLQTSVFGKVREFLMILDPLDTRETATTYSGQMLFFMVALGLGFIHIFFGRIVGFYVKLRSEGIVAAICDQLSWMIIMIGLGMAVFQQIFANVYFKVPASFGTKGLLIAAAGAAIVVLFGGRREKTIVGKIGTGLFEIYGVSSLMGDILSYARLFALGLSTGVIAGVFNKLALMLKGIGGVPGWIFFILLLIIGHLFNIAMNSLGAFIHTLRLQFVEFFGKFYEGGGEEFKPLKRELKYILVEKENIQ